MKVAVVTPYFRESRDLLTQCIDSVRAQTHPCSHILVADGEPQGWVDGIDAIQHVTLGTGHADYGDTPRGIGSVTAIGQQFDAIAYLDADNWYAPQHIASLTALHARSGAAVCTSGRNLHRLDGSLLGPCPDADGERFVDTNCYFLTREAFSLVPVWWSIPPEMHGVGDRMLWLQVLARKTSRAHSGENTVAYRTAFEWHYRHFGETPPPGCKSGEEVAAGLRRLTEMSRGRPPGSVAQDVNDTREGPAR